MIPGLVVAVLALAALVYVTGPIRRPRAVVEHDPTSEAEARKMVALTAILDLESERDAGKLSEADFDDLRSSYEHEALAALAELDAAEQDSDTDPLEREIAALRTRMSATRCPNCGATRDAGATCSRCGV